MFLFHLQSSKYKTSILCSTRRGRSQGFLRNDTHGWRLLHREKSATVMEILLCIAFVLHAADRKMKILNKPWMDQEFGDTDMKKANG